MISFKNNHNSDSDAKQYNTKPKFIKQIINKNKPPPISYASQFWKRKMDLELNKEIWLTPRKTTKEIQLLELQFKIAHNLYPSNILLQKMKIKNTNRCDYCPHEIDFIEHFSIIATKLNPFGYT